MATEAKKRKIRKFDIRHKEALTLCLREYFELFFPDMAQRIDFDTVQFLDKELIALFGQPDKSEDEVQLKITDALILLQIFIDGMPQQILIHWEQQSQRIKEFAERMFHYFCGIYFTFRKMIFPIAMFTDPAKWRKPVESTYSLSLLDYPIMKEFSFRMIKLKHIPSERFEQKVDENPLAAAYLPLTDFPKEDRPRIKAKAMSGIAKIPSGRKQATLVSLVEESIKLSPEEDRKYRQMIKNNRLYKEVAMLQSVEEVYLEKGIEKGMEKGEKKGVKKGEKKGIEKTARNLLKLSRLTLEEIANVTGLSRKRIQELAKGTV